MVVPNNLLEETITKNSELIKRSRDVLAIDLIACNNYKNGISAVKKINIPTFYFGELDKMIKLEKGKNLHN